MTPRLRSVLEQEGIRVAVLKASTVPPDRREDWAADRVREGIDALVCHPMLVQTGLAHDKDTSGRDAIHLDRNGSARSMGRRSRRVQVRHRPW